MITNKKITMRFIITFALIAFIFSNASAQTQTKEQTKSIPKFELGGIGGLSLSNVVGNGVVGSNGIRLGMHLGGYAQFQISDKFGVRPELHIISVKGTSSGDFKTYYFDLPLLGTFDLDDRFKIMAGVQPSILINASVDDHRGDINITDEIRRIDISLLAGLWYEIDENWGIGIRAARGLSRVGASGDEQTYNVNYQLSVGYRFM